jgi:hypothetical protein
MKNLFNADDREMLIHRISLFNTGLTRKWGSMSVQQVVCHLADPFRTALGEKEVPMVKSVFATPVFNRLVLNIMPWPKAAPTAQQFLPGTGATSPTEIERDKQSLILLMHRFAKLQGNPPYKPHPVFGNISANDWARVMWRHVDHHLRQFGL